VPADADPSRGGGALGLLGVFLSRATGFLSALVSVVSHWLFAAGRVLWTVECRLAPVFLSYPVYHLCDIILLSRGAVFD
jgi:hypothetical protein